MSELFNTAEFSSKKTLDDSLPLRYQIGGRADSAWDDGSAFPDISSLRHAPSRSLEWAVGDRCQIITSKKYSGEKGYVCGFHADDSPEIWVKLDNHDLQIRVNPDEARFLEEKQSLFKVGDRTLNNALIQEIRGEAFRALWDNGYSNWYAIADLEDGYAKMPIAIDITDLYKQEEGAMSTTTPKENAECNNSHNLTSAQELEPVFALQVYNSDSSLSEPQKLTNTAQVSSNCDIPTYTTTETCEIYQDLQNAELGIICTQEDSIYLQLPHRAPHSPQKANALEVQTSVIASPQSSKPLENCNLDSQQLKTSQDSLPAPITQDSPQAHISEAWSEPLTNSGTMRNGLLSAVDTLPVPSLESEYCWLPSPGALSSTGKGRPPGQTKQEGGLKDLGAIASYQVVNPEFLESAYNLPVGWTNPREDRSALELLAEMELSEVAVPPSETPLTGELQVLDFAASPTLTPCVENQPLQLKAITLHQPWAYLVGIYKFFETRTWSTNYRGKIAIHAAKQQKDNKYWYEQLKDLLPPLVELPFGSIVAIADLTDCIKMTPEFIAKQSETEIRCGLWEVGRYAWKLENIQILREPIPAKGKQGLWNIELPFALVQPAADIVPQALITKSSERERASRSRSVPQGREDKSQNECTQQKHDVYCPSCESPLITLNNGCGVCGWIPENFLEETEPATTSTEKPKHRQRKGCLYKYLENKKLKNGSIVSYPRVIGHRHPDNPTHWRWGFNWEEKIDGEWKGRSIGSVPLGAIALIQSMQNEGVPLEEIIGFIKRAKAKK